MKAPAACAVWAPKTAPARCRQIVFLSVIRQSLANTCVGVTASYELGLSFRPFLVVVCYLKTYTSYILGTVASLKQCLNARLSELYGDVHFRTIVYKELIDEPENPGKGADCVVSLLHHYSTAQRQLNKRTRVPRVPRVSHACRTRVPRTRHTHICTRSAYVRTYDHATEPSRRATRGTHVRTCRYWYIHVQACARCKYFTVDKTSSIASCSVSASR